MIEDVLRRERLSHPTSQAFFWRTAAGAVFYLLLDRGSERVAVEVKAGRGDDARAVRTLREALPDVDAARGWIVDQSGRYRTGRRRHCQGRVCCGRPGCTVGFDLGVRSFSDLHHRQQASTPNPDIRVVIAVQPAVLRFVATWAQLLNWADDVLVCSSMVSARLVTAESRPIESRRTPPRGR